MINEELIEAFASGISEKDYTSVFLTSRDFVIFKIAGHKFWSGLGCPWRYAPIQYILLRKGEYWMGSGVERQEWEGRTSKQILLKALKRKQNGD